MDRFEFHLVRVAVVDGDLALQHDRRRVVYYSGETVIDAADELAFREARVESFVVVHWRKL